MGISIKVKIIDYDIKSIKNILELLRKQIFKKFTVVVEDNSLNDLSFNLCKLYQRKNILNIVCLKENEKDIVNADYTIYIDKNNSSNIDDKLFLANFNIFARGQKNKENIYQYSNNKFTPITTEQILKDNIASNCLIFNNECDYEHIFQKTCDVVEQKAIEKNNIEDIKFSVIVASYNYSKYIKMTLNSLVDQTYRNFEIIVVDDGSTDDSIEIIQEYQKHYPQIKLFQHEDKKNHGLAETIKLGVLKSKGQYIAFCESDDYWTIDHLRKIYDLIKKYNKNPNIIVNSIKAIGEDQTQIDYAQNANDYRMNIFRNDCNQFNVKNFQFANFILTFSCCTVKKSAILNCTYSTPIDAVIDWWLWSQIIKIDNKLYVQHDVLTYWRQHDSYIKKSNKINRKNRSFSKDINILINKEQYLKDNEISNVKWFDNVKTEKTFKRTAIFAMHSNQHTIDEYVIYYLQQLKTIADNIIVVSDTNINDDQLDKLSNIACCCICQNHNEYDFGSYKRGFQLFISNSKLNAKNQQLIFCNDSCYGPVTSLNNLFDNEELKKYDFFGVTSNSEQFNYHIQTYFFVLNKNAYTSNEFIKFISTIKKQNNVLDVIKSYEIQLTQILKKAKFRITSYLDLFLNLDYIKDISDKNPTKFPNSLLKIQMPFLKKKLVFESQFSKECLYDMLQTIKHKNYKLCDIIKNDILSKIKTTKQVEHPMVSVIVASYNYNNYIKTTLESLVNQTYSNYEIIVVDDGSTDNSIKTILEYQKKYKQIKLFQHNDRKNHGLPETVKRGIEESDGEYLVFCESDDYLDKSYLEEKMKTIVKYDFQPNIIINDIEVIGDNANYDIKAVVENRRSRFCNGKNIIDVDSFKRENLFCTFSIMMMNKKMFENVSYDTPFIPNLDWWLWNQIVKKDNNVYFIDEKLTYWRSHKDSQMAKNKQNDNSKIIEDFLNKLKD